MPQKPRRPCPTCGKLTRTSHCGATARTEAWAELSRQIITAHIRAHGNTCPGVDELDHPPHPTNRLTVDHINGDPRDNNSTNLRVVCATANTQLHNQAAPLYEPRTNPTPPWDPKGGGAVTAQTF